MRHLKMITSPYLPCSDKASYNPVRTAVRKIANLGYELLTADCTQNRYETAFFPNYIGRED